MPTVKKETKKLAYIFQIVALLFLLMGWLVDPAFYPAAAIPAVLALFMWWYDGSISV